MKNKMQVKKEIREAIKNKKITKHDLLQLIKDHNFQNAYNDEGLGYKPQEYDEP